MTKKEKEIFDWILERSWEKRANPTVIAAALALLFPDGAEDVKKDLEKDCLLYKWELMNKCMICGLPTSMNKPLCYVCDVVIKV